MYKKKKYSLHNRIIYHFKQIKITFIYIYLKDLILIINIFLIFFLDYFYVHFTFNFILLKLNGNSFFFSVMILNPIFLYQIFNILKLLLYEYFYIFRLLKEKGHKYKLNNIGIFSNEWRHGNALSRIFLEFFRNN